MQALSWREIDFAGVVLAGLIGGYVMAIFGLWAGKIPGLTAIDIADFGRRYIVSDRPSAWYFGMLSHLANSVILVFLWASLVLPNLDWPRAAAGLAWGGFLAVTLSGALVGPMAGLGLMGRRTGSLRFALTNLAMHGVWGLAIGAIYAPGGIAP